MKRVAILLWILASFIMLSACSVQKISSEKLRDLEFTVVKDDDVPEELMKMIEEKKTQIMKMTFADQGMLYIVEGYGTLPTSGYSIEVEQCFESKNAIYFQSNLIGPYESEKTVEEETYPYIVIKMEYIDKSVVFQ